MYAILSYSSSYTLSSSKVECGVVYISLLFLILFFLLIIDGETYHHALTKVGDCEKVNPGDRVMMEVDLRGGGRERTLHFFIEGRQQKIYFYNLPTTVEFCVCIFLLQFLLLFSHFNSHSHSLSIIISSLLLSSSFSILLIRSVLNLYR